MNIQQEHGKHAEYLAAKWLSRQGYDIFAINWKSSYQEIDIIASNCHFWVFIEVKSQTTSNSLYAENAVNKEKQKNIIKAARRFLIKNNKNKKIRFDIISVNFVPYGVQMFHFKDAFFPIYKYQSNKSVGGFFKPYIQSVQ